MSFLDRFRGQQAPAWASFFTRADFEHFRGVVAADFARRGWRFIEDGDGLVVNPDDPETRREFGLVNLAQQCHLEDRDAWPGIIEGHFDGLDAAFASEGEVPTTWEEARSIIKLRLAGPEVAFPEDVVRYPVAHGLDAALVLDLPTTIAYLRRDAIAEWPAVDELHAVALANMRAEEPPELEVIDAQGAPITWLTGESFFVASRILFLGEVLDATGPYGVLVSVPTRHMLLAHPIRDAQVISAVNSLTVLATNIHRDGPGSVSPALFWWHAGAITVIDTTFDGKRIEVTPPPAFVEVLEALVPGTVS